MNRLLLCAATLACAAATQAQTVLVKPYVQPGNGATLTGADVKVLTWVTDPTPGVFTVEYHWPGSTPQAAKVERVAMDFAKATPKKKADDKDKDKAKTDQKKASDPTKTTPPAPGTSSATTTSPTPADKGADKNKNPLSEAATTLDELKEKVIETFKPIVEKEQHFLRYRAELPGLPFDTEVSYRVRLGQTVVREGTVKTRATPGKTIRFVTVGDMASQKKEQFAIAYQISLQKPDFMIALGDIVYPGGRVIQYMNHFFPCYNDVAIPSAKAGAPIAATVPIYPVIGNHDADTQKFPDYPDAYSAFYWFSVPKNGPGAGPWNLPLGKDEKLITNFKTLAGAEYPAMSDYSFDYGPAHFVMIDANSYAIREYEKLAPWIERDLTQSKQPWKFVCFHQPAFHTSKEHYSEQRMRLLEPMFQRCGVNVVFTGHVHNYQRSKPFLFTPNPPKRDAKGRVNGDFVIDSTYDGLKDTTPEGIIHIVTGGGGASLYSVNLEKTIEFLKKEHGGNYTPITDKYVADRHSFSVIELSPTVFEMRQIDLNGNEVDRFRITK